MIRDHVNAALRSMMLYFAIALFMIYTYTMFHFLYDHETAQVGSKTLHSNTADIQPIWSPLAIVANPLALLYLKCGLREWYGYRPHHRIARRMRSGANMRNGALTIANQLVVTSGKEYKLGFIGPICLQPAEQLHGRDAVPRTSERIAGKKVQIRTSAEAEQGTQ